MRYRAPQKKTLNKRKMLITLIVVAVIIKITVDVSGLNSDAKEALAVSKSEVTSFVDTTSSKLAGSLPKADKVAVIKELATNLDNAIINTCKAQRANWYQLLSVGVRTCDKSIDLLKKVSQSSMRLSQFIEDEARLAGAIPSFDSAKTFEQTYKDWQAAQEQLKNTQVSNDLKDIKSEIMTKVTAYTEAWGEVLSADSDQNPDAYEKATSKLNSVYQELNLATDKLNVKAVELETAMSSDLAAYYSQE